MQKADHAAEKKPYRLLVATNSRARHEFFIEETVEAGIQLVGSEVKSLRTRRVNFADCYAMVEANQCWLIGLHLSSYEKAHVQLPLPARRRRLLLNKREIEKLRAKTEMAGRTLVPLEIYFKGPWAKVLLAVAKGKTHGDKRQALRTAEVKRDIERTLRSLRKRPIH